MAERWNLKRLTHWDVLVVAALCLAVVLLEPMLAGRARKGAERRQCAANLAQIGKAMFAYAGDYDGALPRAGGPTTVWGPTHNWVARNRNAAFDLDAAGNGGRASISSSFYLLVKYYDVPTRAFVCRSDKGTTEFNLEKLVGDVPSFTLARAWDFGPPGESCKHCSYSYHLPYGPFALKTSGDPSLAVAADRNPYIKSPDNRAGPLGCFKPDIDPYGGTAGQAREGNAVTHDLQGQNVLFLDQHVAFEKRSFCGVDRDNIYLVSPSPDKGYVIGWIPIPGGTGVTNERDSVLVHDPPVFSSVASVDVQQPTATRTAAPGHKPHLHDVRADSGSTQFYIGILDEASRFATVVHPDPKIVTTLQWVAWQIPLRDFEQAGIDLTHATKICIGVGNRKKPTRGGTGIMYIDDICLSKSSGLPTE